MGTGQYTYPINLADTDKVVSTSAGVGDAGKLIKTNASGLVDSTFIDTSGYKFSKALNILATTPAGHSSNEVELVNFTLGAGELGTGNAIKIEIPGSLGNGGNGTITLRLKYGGTTLAAAAQVVNSASGSGSVFIVAHLVANASASAQTGTILFNWSPSAAYTSVIANGTATENSATALAVKLTAQWTAGTSGSLSTYSAISQLLKV